jgi:hypothetical protein
LFLTAKEDEQAYQKSKRRQANDDGDDERHMHDEDDEDEDDVDVDFSEDDSDYAANYDDKPKQDRKYWRNSGETTRFWNLINEEKVSELYDW